MIKDYVHSCNHRLVRTRLSQASFLTLCCHAKSRVKGLLRFSLSDVIGVADYYSIQTVPHKRDIVVVETWLRVERGAPRRARRFWLLWCSRARNQCLRSVHSNGRTLTLPNIVPDPNYGCLLLRHCLCTRQHAQHLVQARGPPFNWNAGMPLPQYSDTPGDIKHVFRGGTPRHAQVPFNFTSIPA